MNNSCKTNKRKMEKQSIKQLKEDLSQFEVSKEDALQIEGGPETDRGTVTIPVDDDE